MRIRTLATIVLSTWILVAPADAGVAITPTKIFGGPEYQYFAASNGTTMGWAQNSQARPRRWNAYASMDPVNGGTRLNAPRTEGFFGDVDTDGNEAIYQQVEGSSSDLYLVDITDPTTRTPAPDVNTRRWEWQPRSSDEYIMFNRNYRRAGVVRLLLYDRTTTATTILREDPFRVSVFAGAVGAGYATWTICRRHCSAWIHDIGAATTVKIPTAGDRPQYAPVVDEVHMNAYWVRSRPSCGAGVGFWTAPLADLAAAVKIAALPRGIDTGWSSSLEYDVANDRIDLIFPRHSCRTGDANIFELQGVDTIS
jgi:hypothetical protein